MLKVNLEEINDDTQGVLIRGCVKVERAAQEVVRAVGEEKLLRRRCVAPYVKEDATYTVGCMDQGLVDSTRLDRVFHGHLEGVIDKLIEIIGPDSLVADIYPGGKARKVDIDPVWILRNGVKKAAVLQDVCINGVIEAIGIACWIECLVLMWRKVDPEVTLSLRCIRAITGWKDRNKEHEDKGKGKQKGGSFDGYWHRRIFKILRV